MGTIRCPETSVRNYHYSLRNNPEERTFQHRNSDFIWIEGSVDAINGLSVLVQRKSL